MPRIVTATPAAILEAIALIKAGEIVALPTETVYGLGANALDGDAVAKIFAAKSRPAVNPLIIHVCDIAMAQEYVEMDARALKVAHHFWAGALTLILPKKKNSGVSDLATAGLETLAVRVPNHKIMQAVIKGAGVPIAAPSANSSGQPSATTPKHVAESLGDNAPFILADGASAVGLESTVLDLTCAVPTILRPGAVTREMLLEVLDEVVSEEAVSAAPKSPGLLLKHYAPSIPMRLRCVDVKRGEALLAFGSTKFMGIEGGGHVKDLPEERFRNLSEEGDLNQAAHNLFTMMRDLDHINHSAIAVMNIPDIGIGIAINERLRRAAKG